MAFGDAAFVAWGWRVAFIASGLFIGVGVWMRTRVEESPLYLAYAERRAGRPRAALGPTLAAHWREVLTVLLVKAGENALFYVFSTFFVVYITRVLQSAAIDSRSRRRRSRRSSRSSPSSRRARCGSRRPAAGDGARIHWRGDLGIRALSDDGARGHRAD